MSDIIQPRVLKGFRDFLPEAEMERAALMEKLDASFRSFGFVPIDTPVLEYAEILLGKAGGETEKQVYRFKDNGGRDVAMRFDLTVPFARFMAEHVGELYLPFKRYHMAKVWRGENTQRGRYREFMQCDFDIVGVDTASADFEIVAIIAAAMVALGVPDTTIHVNHRGVFNRFLASVGRRTSRWKCSAIVDKLSKIGEDETRRSCPPSPALRQPTRCSSSSPAERFQCDARPDDATGRWPQSRFGPARPTCSTWRKPAVWPTRFVLSPNITRGLDYYTGVVFETFLDAMPEIGSVCSGGRYNDLASLYTKPETSRRRRLGGHGPASGRVRGAGQGRRDDKLDARRRPQPRRRQRTRVSGRRRCHPRCRNGG